MDKSWKSVAFETYKKFLGILAILDFEYPIDIADNELKRFIDQTKQAVAKGSDVFSNKYINNKDDIWKLMVEQIIRMSEEALKTLETYKRRECYYGIANYVTDFIELNRKDLM